MTITMTKDSNPPTPFLFPGVGEQASLAMAEQSPDRCFTNDRRLGAPRLDVPFCRGGGAVFSNSQVRKQDHEHGVLF